LRPVYGAGDLDSIGNMTAPRPPRGADAIRGAQVPTHVEPSERPVTRATCFPAGRAPEALFHGLTPPVVVALQRTAGNAAVTALLARQPITPPPDAWKTIGFTKSPAVWVNNAFLYNPGLPDPPPASVPHHKYDWQVPPDARTVKIGLLITGDSNAPPPQPLPPNVVARMECGFEVATDGRLIVRGQTVSSYNQQWAGATLKAQGGLRDVTPNAVTLVLQQTFDASPSGGSAHDETIEFTIRSLRRREKITRTSLTGFGLDSARLTSRHLAQLRRFLTRGTPSAVDKLQTGKAKARITGFADATGTSGRNEIVAAGRLFSLEMQMASEFGVPISAFETPKVDGSQSAEDERSQHPEKPKADPKWRKVDIEIVDQ
jgi:outer membrane protein OmpA-like peptidoglycan-associated protein